MSIFQFTYTEFSDSSDLDSTFQQLLSHARNITANAYAPYSNFCVGAAVLFNNGTIIGGVNIENAAYPVGICAERSALASAISQYPQQEILAIAISYASLTGTDDTPAFPCGMCRQFISECEDRNKKSIQILLAGKNGKVIVIEKAKDLLPFSFGGKDLK